MTNAPPIPSLPPSILKSSLRCSCVAPSAFLSELEEKEKKKKKIFLAKVMNLGKTKQNKKTLARDKPCNCSHGRPAADPFPVWLVVFLLVLVGICTVAILGAAWRMEVRLPGLLLGFTSLEPLQLSFGDMSHAWPHRACCPNHASSLAEDAKGRRVGPSHPPERGLRCRGRRPELDLTVIAGRHGHFSCG